MRCDVVAVAAHDALLGNDLQIAEAQVGRAHLGRARPAQQRPDASRELLGGEGLGEVVVGPGLETGDDVVGVGPGRHHDDGDVGGAADRPAHLEAVDARQHDVDQHHVGRAPAGSAAGRPRRWLASVTVQPSSSRASFTAVRIRSSSSTARMRVLTPVPYGSSPAQA